MLYSKEKLEEVKAAAAAGPCVAEEIQAYDKWKAPVYFSCTSGVLLWGQLPTVMQGHLKKKLDTPLGPLHEDYTNKPGGYSIVTSNVRYRAPARKGLWKVEAVFTGKPNRPVGYVCYHIDVNGPDILRRAALICGSSGFSLWNDHADRDITYIHRDDWANKDVANDGYKLMKKLLKPEKKKLKEQETPANSMPLKTGKRVELKVLEHSKDEEVVLGSIVSSFTVNNVEYYYVEYGGEEDDEEEQEDEEEEEHEAEDEEQDSEDSEFYDYMDRKGLPYRMTKRRQRKQEKKKAKEAKEAYTEGLMRNRLMLVDEEGFPQLVQTMREGFKLDSKNSLFRDNKKATTTTTELSQDPPSISDAFGVNLGVCAKGSYELGWMAFQEEELIGFVYDGAYCDLFGESFQCGDTEVEVVRPSESENESADDAFEFEESDEPTSHRSPGGSSIKVCPNCSSLGGSMRVCSKCGDRGQIARDDGGQVASRPPNPYLQPQPSRAVKIVNPATGEEVIEPYDRRLTQVQDYGGQVVRDSGVQIGRDSGGQIARDNGGHTHIAHEYLSPKKRKHGGSQSGQWEVRKCDQCHRDGHTRDHCFKLHPELRKVRQCDHCHRDGHTRDSCFALHPELRAQMSKRRKIVETQ